MTVLLDFILREELGKVRVGLDEDQDALCTLVASISRCTFDSST